MMKDDREIFVSKISRSQSKVSHYLATYGLCTPRTMVWLGGSTSEVVNLCKNDAQP